MDHNHLTMKTFMAITAERDAAIRERNMALEERKRAFADRDMAMLQRDAAIAERNAAIRERDETIASLRYYRDNSSMNNSIGNELDTGVALMQYSQQQHQMSLAETAGCNSPSPRGSSLRGDNEFEMIEIAKKPMVKDVKRKKPAKSPRKKSTKSSGAISNGWNSNDREMESDNDYDDEDVMNKDRVVLWKDNLGGLNEMNFDESAMPVPVCSCTGSPQPCYRWGKGGWQSACCTTTISMYPLPQMANKRYSRVGGRKMSGSAFGKLLNRLAGEGYDFSTPLDLKERWAKHGTNRYSTLK